VRNVPSTDKGKAPIDVDLPSEGDLRQQFVVVPPGDEAKNISCPICKEHMKCEFLEDDEEWVWRNAILKEDKVCHILGALALPIPDCRCRTDLPCYLPCRGNVFDKQPCCTFTQ